PRTHAPAHPALELPLAGRVLPAAPDRSARRRRAPRHLPLRQQRVRAADRERKAPRPTIRAVGRGDDGRDVPRPRGARAAEVGSARYSYCSALRTFRREARRAGRIAATIPARIASTTKIA